MLNKIKAMHTIEYLRNEIESAERAYATNELNICESEYDKRLQEAFKLVLEFVEDCNEDYLEDFDALDETTTKLQILTEEIDREESKDDECDADLVVEDLYAIKEIVAKLFD